MAALRYTVGMPLARRCRVTITRCDRDRASRLL